MGSQIGGINAQVQVLREGSGMVWKCSERQDPPAHARQVESGREVGVTTNGDCTLLFSGVLQFLLRLFARFFGVGLHTVGEVEGGSSGWKEGFQVSTDLVRG